LEPSALVVRGDGSIRGLEGIKNFKKIFKGDETSLKQGQAREDDVLFAANFIDGQKTGFFIDQRENRRHLKKHAEGKRVLDLCCYSGGWGLTALKGRAEHVTFVDQSSEALNLVERGIALNGFDGDRCLLVEEDVFDFLQKDGNMYDIIVADPPAFVKSKKNLPQAIKAYKKLNELALQRLKPSGLLYSCSCSFHLSDEAFEEILRESFQKTGRVGTVVHRGSQGADHPWIINRPESKYLKVLGLQAIASTIVQ
jgi:23S rRNA (cytosine1962-C5)-methyltransferase